MSFIKNPTAGILNYDVTPAYVDTFNEYSDVLSGSKTPQNIFSQNTPMRYIGPSNIDGSPVLAGMTGNTGDSNFLGLSQDGWGNLGQGILGAFNIYSGLQANKLAKQQLAFAKQQYSTNLANSIKSYNTQLADKINSRYAVEGKSSADAAAYLEANKL